jgi:hypothetical protein
MPASPRTSPAASALFGGSGSSSRFLPDLTLWYRWHASRRTLPAPWKGMQLEDVCASLGVPCWRPRSPWRQETPGVEVTTTEGAAERVTTWKTPAATLVSKWTLGPDGDWWQAEYPVKSAADLGPALEVARARRYVLDPARLSAGESPGILELPLRPFSEVLHSFIGWTEGLMLLFEAPEEIQAVVDALEERFHALAAGLAGLSPAAVLSPDNLDGQFISPPLFEEHMQGSYARSAAVLHAAGAKLVVHVGGPVRGLLPGLAAAGVDAIEGICAAPQSDAGIVEARSLCGPGPVLWGGVAQDALLASQSEESFTAEMERAAAEAAADGRAVVGVADRVPVEAVPARLEQMARRLGGA